MMEISYVLMKNFRQYRDVKIEFARSGGGENFTIIQGANGAGKTNLLNAITWCLFGNELHMDSKYKGLPILNTTSLEETEEGNLCEVKVEIQLVQSDGKKMRITRKADFKKGSKGIPVEVSDPHAFCIMRETERDWVGPIYADDAQYIVNNLVPPSIEEYFFFDGERLDDYFRDNTGTDIRNAVFKISHLELLEKVIAHLKARKRDFVRSARGLSSEAEKIRQMIEVQTRSLETDNEMLEELTAKKVEAEQNERVFIERLKNSSLERIQSLEERREELDIDLSRIQEEIEGLETGRLKTLHQYMPSILCYEALLKMRKLIEGRRESGLIPPLYQEIFIRNLLKKGKCICGSDITEKDEYSSRRRKKVEEYLEVSRLSDMSNELVEANVRLSEMLEGLTAFPQEVIELGRRLKKLQDTKSEKNDTLRKISQEIEMSNAENIRAWEKERKKYAEEKDRLKVDIAMQKDRIKRRENIIRAHTIKLNRELKKEKKHEALLRKLAFCDKGIRCAEQLEETIMREVKVEIERRTSRQFLDLIWKKKTYERVAIDDDYNISVPHIDGREALGTLSAGERQVCALSFMAALNSVSGFEVPIIIDTPLARISSEPRRSIGRNLPNYLEGTQVTLLVTEEEYTSEVKEGLSERIGKTYMLNFLEKERGGLVEVSLIK